MILPPWVAEIAAPSIGSLLNINSIMWVVYGYVQGAHALIPINSLGILFTIWYIMMYYSACDSNQRKTIEIFLLVGDALALIWTAIAFYALPEFGYARDMPMGIACIIPNVSFYASPLLSLAKVVRTKSTASLSLPLTLSSFACAFFWSLFGVGVQDPFVLLPNLLGVACSMIQLVLFGYYGVCMKNIGNSFARIYKRQMDNDQEQDDIMEGGQGIMKKNNSDENFVRNDLTKAEPYLM